MSKQRTSFRPSTTQSSGPLKPFIVMALFTVMGPFTAAWMLVAA
jgi:hypothetical protein